MPDSYLPSSPGGNILVVDDTVATLQMLASILAAAGHHVRTATDGTLALRSARAELPDLILLDVRMPGLDGYEVCRRLKADEHTRLVPVIFTTWLDETPDKVRGFQVGAVDYIGKPFDDQEVLARVATHVALRRTQAELEAANCRLQADIHAHGQTTAALQESEARLREILENSLDSAYRRNLQTNAYDYISPTFTQITGYTREEMATTPIEAIFDRVHPDDVAGMKQAVAESLAGRPQQIEYRLRHKDGRYRWVMDQFAVVMAADGKPLSLVGSVRDVTTRRQAQEDLRLTLERLNLATQAAQLGIWDWDLLKNELVWDDRMCALYGLKREDSNLPYEDWVHALYPDDRVHGEMEAQRAFRGEKDYDTEFRVQRPDGTVRVLKAYAQVVRDSTGQPIRMTGVNFDITARKEAEAQIRQLNEALEHRVAERTAQLETVNQELRDSQAKYYALFSEMLNGCALHELLYDAAGQPVDYITLEVNQAFETLLGASRDVVVGQKASDILPPAELEKWLGIFGPVALTGQPAHYEMYSPVNQRHFEGNAYCPVKGKFAVIFADVTASLQAKAALEHANAYNRGLIEASLDPLVTIGPDGQITDVNRATEEVTGCSREQLIGTDFSDYFTDPDRARAVYRQVFRDGLVRDYALEIRHASGRVTPVHYNATVYWDEAGIILGVFAAARDITVQKQTEEEIRRLNVTLEARVEARTAELHEANLALTAALRVKDEFLAVMSHELRTPLTAVMGLAEVLQLKVYGPLTEKQAKALQTIYANGQHLLALITDVLDFVQAEAGQRLGEASLVQVAELCEACLSVVQPVAERKNLRLLLQQAPEADELWVDGQSLKRMLVQLLDNAVKFTPEDGDVGLMVRLSQGTGPLGQAEIYFTIWDTGIGISPADQHRLFQPFVQLDTRLARQYEGTGLGLALVRRLADLCGGRVILESEGILGQGSRFSVCLPWTPGRGKVAHHNGGR
jgi:PAS domain S-box-containing protein